jgi:cyclopropane fatty-acyl-phospholipid synthase-like methyltransferase
VPSQFYTLCLGKHLKYSCCLYEKRMRLIRLLVRSIVTCSLHVRVIATSTLEEAERAMLDLYIQRAGIVDGKSYNCIA